MKVYMAHPYGGDRTNIERAAKLARRLKAEHPDWIIVSPLHLFSWLDYDTANPGPQLLECVQMMELCDLVYFSAGWTKSHGCRMEYAIANARNMQMVFEEALPEKPKDRKSDAVNHPSHYCRGGMECIDAIRAAVEGLTAMEAVCTGNAMKYLWRWKEKNGAEDLKKADWYIRRLLWEMEK